MEWLSENSSTDLKSLEIIPKTFRVEVNHNYTVSIFDRNDNKLTFRDLKGSDLEFFEKIIGNPENKEDVKLSSFDLILMLNHLSVDGVSFSKFTLRAIYKVFELVSEKIISPGYLPKISWLQACYGIQNGSFVNVLAMEEVPMSKFMAMIKIHQEAIDRIKTDNK